MMGERVITLTFYAVVAAMVLTSPDVPKVIKALADAVNFNASCILAGECQKAGMK